MATRIIHEWHVWKQPLPCHASSAQLTTQHSSPASTRRQPRASQRGGRISFRYRSRKNRKGLESSEQKNHREKKGSKGAVGAASWNGDQSVEHDMNKRPDVPHAPGRPAARKKKNYRGLSKRKPTVKWSERRVGERSHRRTSSGIGGGQMGWGGSKDQAGEREG